MNPPISLWIEFLIFQLPREVDIRHTSILKHSTAFKLQACNYYHCYSLFRAFHGAYIKHLSYAKHQAGQYMISKRDAKNRKATGNLEMRCIRTKNVKTQSWKWKYKMIHIITIVPPLTFENLEAWTWIRIHEMQQELIHFGTSFYGQNIHHLVIKEVFISSWRTVSWVGE